MGAEEVKPLVAVGITLLVLLSAACTGQDESPTPSPTTSTMDQASASPFLTQGCAPGEARVYAETECLPTHGPAPVCIWTPHGDTTGCALVAGSPPAGTLIEGPGDWSTGEIRTK